MMIGQIAANLDPWSLFEYETISAKKYWLNRVTLHVRYGGTVEIEPEL